MCVQMLSTAVRTFARCPSAAAVDPATVTLVNVPANIFFQYPVNKFERPRTWWVLIENHDRKNSTCPSPARGGTAVPRSWPAGLVRVVGCHWAPQIFSTRGFHLTNRDLKLTPSYSRFPEARPTTSIDTYLKTDPIRRICISHHEYSELTVHEGIAQLYRFIIEFASSREL